VNYTIPAEIVFPDLYHSRGSVAAAREPDDVNPDYESSASQFYIVWGEKMTPGKMKRSVSYLKGRGIELDRFMIDEYQVCGGSPHLDGAYTVFGEVIEGLVIVGEIQALPTDSKDRPLDDILIIRAVVEQLSENVSSLENK
jgi:peptidyl-prolyl cis-trans isomerase B (cyclophilin B)